jgi:hypothetical protein
MSWNINLEIFKITIPSDNINWQELTLKIKENIKYLPIYFHCYTSLFTNKLQIPALNKLNYTHDDIIKHWENNKPPEFTKLQYNTDYYIAPMIVIEKTIILGIFIYGLIPEFIYESNDKINNDKINNDKINNDKIKIFCSLSYISNNNTISNNIITNSKKLKKPNKINKINKINKKFIVNINRNNDNDNDNVKCDFTFNIIAGIIKYIKGDNILNNTCKYIIINNKKINWMWILCNIVNYLPVFKINIINIASKNKFIPNNKNK